jgi:hypothetical protein
MDTMDMDTDMTAGTDVVICIRIRGIHIRVPGGFSVPVSITNCNTLMRSFTNCLLCEWTNQQECDHYDFTPEWIHRQQELIDRREQEMIDRRG